MTATLISDCEDCGTILADSAGWRKWCEENPEKCAYQPTGKRVKGEPLRAVGTFTRLTPAQAEQEDFDKRVSEGVDPEVARKRVDDLRKYGMTHDVWRSSTGATAKFSDRAKVTDAKKQEVMETLDELVESEPHPGWGKHITVGVEDTKGVASTYSAEGITMRGSSMMLLAPSAVKPGGQKRFDAAVESGLFMPAGAGVSQTRYTITHEYGHIRDIRQGRERKAETEQALRSIPAGSKYGQSNQALRVLSGIHSAKKDGSEAFAESFAEWHLSGGKTTDPLAIALAKSEGWK